MEELREPLGLPNIGGYLIAYANKYYKSETETYETRVSWRIDIIIPGPDSRYNPGSARCQSSLLLYFEKAHQQMRLLEKQSFSGEYCKVIDDSPSSKIEVKASSGNIKTFFWAKSGTYMFSRSLSLIEVEQSIAILKEARQKAETMVKFDVIAHNFPRYLGRDKNKFRAVRQLQNDYFIEVKLSAQSIQKFCYQAMETIELTSEDWNVTIN